MTDPLRPPPWVRQAMRDRRRVVKVNPNDPTGYIEDLARRAPQSFHDSLNAIIKASRAKGGPLKG